MINKTEALRLADWIDSDFDPDEMHEVGYDAIAKELRRLHEENEQLRNLAATCYAGLGAECDLPENWLDALNNAASGEPFETEALLPFVSPMRAELIQQTNRAATAEQEVIALRQRLDTANALNTEARNELAAIKLAQAVPDGWKLVPVEPTSEMLKAGECAHNDKQRDMNSPYPTEFPGECGGPFGYAYLAMLAASPTPPARNDCWCETCRPVTLSDMRFIVCPDCGNKRCPKANHHDNACTNSNAPGQPGSSWEHVKPQSIQGDPNAR